MGNWTSYPTHTKLNGNLYERFDTQDQVINITDDNSDVIVNTTITEEFNKLKNELHIIHSKIKTIELSLNNTNSRISVITPDLESLLNNDKLLLDKLIEKNIVSTIQEEDTHEYPSGIEQYQSVDTNQTPLDEVNL